MKLKILLLVFLIPNHLFAQHDEARNAVRFIADGNFAKAEETITGAKVAQAGKAESRFVEMLSLLAQDKVDLAMGKARDALKEGLPFERLLLGPKEQLVKLHSLPAFQDLSKKFKSGDVLVGPMLGNVTSDSISVWLRTYGPGEVTVTLFDADGNEVKKKKVATQIATDNTSVVTFDDLKPNTTYRYGFGDKKGKVKTRPLTGTPSKFKVAFGGGAGFVPKWEYMWDTILAKKPDAMLMLGDNVYIDQPQYSMCQHYCYYRRQCRPEWKRLTAAVPVYSIWDDHDFATNDCNNGPFIDKPEWKPKVWNTFKQNWVNPAFGGGEKQPGCWYDFHIGDVHFVMLDGRYYRHRQGKTMLGPVQKAWVKKTLKESKATFKIMISPVPFTPKIKPGSKDPWDGFPEEREELFSFIGENTINGVFLVAADRHRTDLRKISRPKSYDLYEFMSSKLTNRHTHKVVKTDGLVWGYNKTCSFGLMEFDTTAADPQVIMKCVSIDGEVLHQHTLRVSQLK